jgi:hypothetical protein
VTSFDAMALACDLRGEARGDEGAARPHVPETRQLVRQLIEGKLICRPLLKGGRPGFEFAATGTYRGLLEAVNDSGGGHGSRTRDPDVANVVLSQLS